MIYLATPYSRDPDHGFQIASDAAVYLLRKEKQVISPILHWHHVAKLHALPLDAQSWWRYNRALLSRCSSLVVYTVPEWETSVGVRMEIEYWLRWRREEPVYLSIEEVHENR